MQNSDRKMMAKEMPPLPDFPVLSDGILALENYSSVLKPGMFGFQGRLKWEGQVVRADDMVPYTFQLTLFQDHQLSIKARSIIDQWNIHVLQVTKEMDFQDNYISYFNSNNIVAELVRPDRLLFGVATETEQIETILKDLDTKLHDISK